MPCPPCKLTVPIVSIAWARHILGQLTNAERTSLIEPSIAWLVEQHEGLQVYEGILDRDYTQEERKEIAFDQGVVADLPCPFVALDECPIKRLGIGYTYESEYGRVEYLWLPTIAMRELDRSTLRSLIRQHAVADAKAAFATRPEQFVYRGVPTAEDTLNGSNGSLPMASDPVIASMAGTMDT